MLTKLRHLKLTESPFVWSLLIGASKGGYWNTFHVELQFEDTVDCLKILNPELELVFLFDQSQEHARKKDGALDANNMSRSFGGVQSKMWRTIIVDGCLGPYDRKLNVGNSQSMVFEPDGIGPWWYSTEEIRESRRHDIIDHNSFIMVNRTRAQLAQALTDGGITVDSSPAANKLKEFAVQHGSYGSPTMYSSYHQRMARQRKSPPPNSMGTRMDRLAQVLKIGQVRQDLQHFILFT